MKYYAYIRKSNNTISGTGTCKAISESNNCIEISEDLYNNINITNGKNKYIYDTNTGTLIENPEYENILRANEKDRIQGLSMTPLDFIKVLEIRAGITYEQIKSLCDKYPMIDKELRFCQNVYRNNPMFSQESLAQLPSEFHLTDGELDDLFVYVDNIKQSNQTI